MKVSTAVNQFMVYGRIERQYALETQAKHRDCFQSWILPFFSENEIEEVGRYDILRMREAMLSRQLSSARQTSVLAAWKVLLGFARSVLKLPCADPAEIKLPRKELPHPQVLSSREQAQVFATLNLFIFTDMRMRAFCELILGTGVRLGEALRMEREPFDHGATEMDIIGKGAKRRTVFFSERALLWIKQYLAKRADDHPALFITTGSSPRRWARPDISKHFQRLAARAGLERKFTPHILRHTYCTTLLNNGVDISFIKELAGHQDIQTTARYYLGIDKPALRRIVKEKLRYGVDEEFDTNSNPS
jgi:site-specific recombinase XerD